MNLLFLNSKRPSNLLKVNEAVGIGIVKLASTSEITPSKGILFIFYRGLEYFLNLKFLIIVRRDQMLLKRNLKYLHLYSDREFHQLEPENLLLQNIFLRAIIVLLMLQLFSSVVNLILSSL